MGLEDQGANRWHKGVAREPDAMFKGREASPGTMVRAGVWTQVRGGTGRKQAWPETT